MKPLSACRPPVHPLSGRGVAMSCGPTKLSETHLQSGSSTSRPPSGFGRSSTTTCVLALDRPRRGNRASSPGTCSSGSPRPASRRRACRCREVDQASAATIRVIHKGCGRGACRGGIADADQVLGDAVITVLRAKECDERERPVPMQIDRVPDGNRPMPDGKRGRREPRRCFQSLAIRRSRPVRTLLMRGPP